MFEITETVLVASITLLAGIVGSSIGALATIKTANIKIKQALLQETLKNRQQAYANMLTSHRKVVSLPYLSEEWKLALKEFEASAAVAMVVASQITTLAIINMVDYIRAGHDTGAVLADLMKAVQTDMSVFTNPEIEKNYQFKKSPKKRAHKE